MTRSVLASTFARGARAELRAIHRADRRRARYDAHLVVAARCRCGGDLTADGCARCDADVSIDVARSDLWWTVDRRRAAAKTGPFVRWARARLDHVAPHERRAAIRGDVTVGPVGQYVWSALVGAGVIERVGPRDRWFSRRLPRRAPLYDLVYQIARFAITYGYHAELNAWAAGRVGPLDGPGAALCRWSADVSQTASIELLIAVGGDTVGSGSGNSLESWAKARGWSLQPAMPVVYPPASPERADRPRRQVVHRRRSRRASAPGGYGRR